MPETLYDRIFQLKSEMNMQRYSKKNQKLFFEIQNQYPWAEWVGQSCEKEIVKTV